MYGCSHACALEWPIKMIAARKMAKKYCMLGNLIRPLCFSHSAGVALKSLIHYVTFVCHGWCVFFIDHQLANSLNMTPLDVLFSELVQFNLRYAMFVCLDGCEIFMWLKLIRFRSKILRYKHCQYWLLGYSTSAFHKHYVREQQQ